MRKLSHFRMFVMRKRDTDRAVIKGRISIGTAKIGDNTWHYWSGKMNTWDHVFKFRGKQITIRAFESHMLSCPLVHLEDSAEKAGFDDVITECKKWICAQ